MIGSKVGNETKAETKRVQSGGTAAAAAGTKESLKHAVAELGSQHPRNSRGPNHGGTEHIRHAPVVKVYRGR